MLCFILTKFCLEKILQKINKNNKTIFIELHQKFYEIHVLKLELVNYINIKYVIYFMYLC